MNFTTVAPLISLLNAAIAVVNNSARV